MGTKRWQTRLQQAWCIATGALALTVATFADSGPGDAVTASTDPSDLRLMIRDTAVPFDDRVDLVTTMLDHQGDASTAWLIRELNDAGTASSRRAVLKALIQRPADALAPFHEALLPLLDTDDELLHPLTVQALGKIDEPGVVQRLIVLAGQSTASTRQRRGAVQALAHHPQRDVAAALLALTDHEDPRLRGTVFAALRAVTGEDGLPDSAASWQRWWNQRAGLTALAWQHEVTRTLAAGMRHRVVHRQQLEIRLAESLRLHYLGSASERRTELLIAWLEDPLPSIRQLAINLVAQRLVDVGAEPVREPLRVALRHGLHTEDPSMRRRAADALRQLDDAPAAAIVAERLAARSEPDPEVLAAYLRLVRHVPQRQAIEPLITMMLDPRATRLAADALTAALDVEDQAPPWITPKQAMTVRGVARRHLEVVNPQTPSMIRLLARIAAPQDREDWRLIASFLDSSVDRVKEAAAEAWAESDQPLGPLGTRAFDEVIQPFLYGAAIQRGDSDSIFAALAVHPPAQPSRTPNWEQALIALAGRICSTEVLRVADQITVPGEGEGLRVSLLTAAILAAESAGTKPPCLDEASSALTALLLSRAETLLDAGQARRSLPDYQRIISDENLGTTPAQAHAARRGALQAMLATAQVAAALAVAKEDLVATDDTDPAGQGTDVVELLIDAARRGAESEDTDQARTIHDFLTSQVDAQRLAPFADAMEWLGARLGIDPSRDNAVDAEGTDPPVSQRDG